jgi:hypothetical protein
MKLSLRNLTQVLAITLIFAIAVFAQKPTAPQGEIDAAKKIEVAKDFGGKFKAAEEFMKKYSKSVIRPQVAQILAEEIYRGTDPKARLTQYDAYSKLFNTDEEMGYILTGKVDALISTGSIDEGFKLAPKALEKQPEQPYLLTQLAIAGRNALQQGKPEYAGVSKSYAAKAIELIEADKMPEKTDAKNWELLKKQQLPELYFSQGLILYSEQDVAGSKASFEKSAKLSPNNPNNYFMLSALADNDYKNAAMEYNLASNAEKPAKLKKAEAAMDVIIDYSAHALALVEGKPESKAMYDQLLGETQNIYKLRYKAASADGLKAIIEKYKVK